MSADSDSIDVLLLAATDDQPLVDAFDRADRFDLTVVDDTDDAVTRLFGRGGAEPPQLLLIELDDDAGEEDEGVSLLQQVKDDEYLRRVPAITISDSAEACVASYERHANAHIERPTDPEDFDEVVDRIESFWVHTATLPPVTNDS